MSHNVTPLHRQEDMGGFESKPNDNENHDVQEDADRRDDGRVRVALNVYNLAPGYNRVAHSVGMVRFIFFSSARRRRRGSVRKVTGRLAGAYVQGAYHTGVQVSGREYSFSNEGVTNGVPKQCPPDVTFFKSITIGYTHLSVSGTVARLRLRFAPGSYDILEQNCNHFSDALCRALLDKGIPSWVNRLARTGVSIDSGKSKGATTAATSEQTDATDATQMPSAKLSKSRNKISKEQRRLLEMMKKEGGKKKKKRRARKGG